MERANPHKRSARSPRRRRRGEVIVRELTAPSKAGTGEPLAIGSLRVTTLLSPLQTKGYLGRVRSLTHEMRVLAGCGAIVFTGAAVPLAAQGRVVERHDADDPEGQLMAYYSTSLAFSPVAAPGWASDRGGIGLELTFIPPLSRAQRTEGGSKVESTNLAPLLPRPRLDLALPWRSRLELSWVPPVTAFGVTANLWAMALTRPLAVARGMLIVPRVAVSGGHATGPITCNDALARNGEGDSLYFALVCHGRESADRFEPRALSAELTGTHALRSTLGLYAGLGTRLEHTKFRVGVRLGDGSPDPDHPILEMHALRGYLLAGATWTVRARAHASAELFYAPGTVLTARAQAALRLPRQ